MRRRSSAQRKIEKFTIGDVERTADVWKKNGGEIITLPDAEAKAYLAQVEVGAARRAWCQPEHEG